MGSVVLGFTPGACSLSPVKERRSPANRSMAVAEYAGGSREARNSPIDAPISVIARMSWNLRRRTVSIW